MIKKKMTQRGFSRAAFCGAGWLRTSALRGTVHATGSGVQAKGGFAGIMTTLLALSTKFNVSSETLLHERLWCFECNQRESG